MASERNVLGPVLFLLGVCAPLAAHRLGYASPVTGAALAVYAMAAAMAAGVLDRRTNRHAKRRTRGTVLIAAGLEPAALRRLLAGGGADTVAVYRTDRVTAELLDLRDRHGVVLVVGAEHDPRAKERLSASGLSRQVPDIAEREVILAGPRHFQRYVRGALSRLAVPGTQVHTARNR
ncbi:hypothetical protein ACQEUU_32825 [Nonomuraea sp. CA-218870]|uniref:hypothetical protein n=1 Tax=Nonomuraea sp. CA-218870 TaxID=3239998 RepID=UPI003D8AFD13